MSVARYIAQTMERLYLKGELVYMALDPLWSYLENLPDKHLFGALGSRCWKGYIGTWEIKDEKLYLISLFGNGNHPQRWYSIIDIEFLFPKQREVFAEWFTGELRIPQGSILKHIDYGWQTVYESDLFINVKNGNVVGYREVDNYVKIVNEIINKKKENSIENERIQIPDTSTSGRTPKENKSFLNKFFGTFRVK